MTQTNNILIVDDSKFARGHIGSILKELGISEEQIFYAEDGEQALQLLETHRFELVILDIIMTGIDGIAVLKEIKNANALTKVIMCSSSNSNELIKESVALGISAFVVKPFDKDDFKAILSRHISSISETNPQHLVVKCHKCDSQMIEVNLINTLIFFCPNKCMQIGPMVKALATQQQFDKDYENARRN